MSVERIEQMSADLDTATGPLFGLMLLPVRVPFARLEATARAADEAGFDGLWMFDHLDTPHADRGSPTLDVYEGWTTATMLAARTERIRIGHNVLCSSFRHPVLLAKMAATLDVASGGRLELGIGWGSMPDELRRFGFGVESGAVRAERMAETLDILQLMFTGEPFSFEGIHYSVPDGVGRPRPVKGRIPIQIGGLGPKLTLPLVARYADWWNCPSNGLDRFHELRPLVGSARVALQVLVAIAPSTASRDQVAADTRQRFEDTWGGVVVGTPDEVAARLQGFVDRGVEQLIIQFADYGRRETIDLFATEVIPAVRRTEQHSQAVKAG
jgi:alkanesulfonate monooxygenase SsuD/methylene tetrahydromethanopterin reductase-like flavin-dependent oxidoreductase (luciferase family)